ncbi:MAG: hypothetical protein AAF196_08725 [Planctomycetota bacterium]
MRGDRLEHELSLDLDGRLSPARRAALYETLKNDPQARALRTALVESRETARSAERNRVSAGFHESLMRRVEAGEGTPEASFRQPIPWSARLRDLGIGAAAAALVLIGVQALSSDDDLDPTRTLRQDEVAVNAGVEPTEGPEAMRLDSSSGSSLRPIVDRSNLFNTTLAGAVPPNANFVQPSPWVVADEAQNTFVNATDQLRRQLLATSRDDTDQSRLMRRVQRLTPSAQRARAAAEMLAWMSREQFVDLPPALAGGLEAVRSVSIRLDRAARSTDSQSRRILWELEAAREQIERIEIETLGHELMVRCCDTQQAFADQLLEQVLQSRGPMPLNMIHMAQPTEMGTLQVLQQFPGGHEIQIFIVRQR